ncbi:MAG TPA: hypothetical protein VJ246_03555 [Patescibacteria group bacterium]|nr:hypothetical protein [Patescibacteria group bacterium]
MITLPPLVAVALIKLLGVVVGLVVPYVDAAAYALFLYPQSIEGAAFREALKLRKPGLVVREVLQLLQQPLRFIHRGILFFATYAAMSVFVITSTNAALGKGVVAGIGIYMLMGMLAYRTNIIELRKRYFWGLAGSASNAAYMGLIVTLVVLTVFALII